MARIPPNVIGSIIQVTVGGETRYHWPQQPATVGEVNLAIGTLVLEGRVVRGAGETDLVSFKPSFTSTASLSLEHWQVDFPISEPYWVPKEDWQVTWLKRETVSVTRGSGDSDTPAIVGTVVALLTDEILTYTRDYHWEWAGGQITWLNDVTYTLVDEGLPTEHTETTITPRARPSVGTSYTLAYTVRKTNTYTSGDAGSVVDLGVDSVAVESVENLGAGPYTHDLTDTVTCWAKLIRPPADVSLDSDQAYEFDGTVKRRMVENEDYRVVEGAFEDVVPTTSAELRFDYNHVVRPAQA